MPCQVIDPGHAGLICPERESGGYRCERAAPHGDNEHWVSNHTIRHAALGNGYTCVEVAAMLSGQP
jgi:hypothetical protein